MPPFQRFINFVFGCAGALLCSSAAHYLWGAAPTAHPFLLFLAWAAVSLVAVADVGAVLASCKIADGSITAKFDGPGELAGFVAVFAALAGCLATCVATDLFAGVGPYPVVIEAAIIYAALCVARLVVRVAANAEVEAQLDVTEAPEASDTKPRCLDCTYGDSNGSPCRSSVCAAKATA